MTATPRLAFLRQVWTHLIRPYWTSEDKWAAYGLLAGHLALMGLVIYISVRINYWSNDFYTSLQELNGKAFLSLLGIFSILAFFHIMFGLSKSYFLMKLQIRWRQWMTQVFLENWTHERRYYALQLKGDGSDNPDQRIAEDVHKFINSSLDLSIGFFQNTITLISFLGILWALSGTLIVPLGNLTFFIPGYMCWGAIVYAVGGTFIALYLGRPLIRLDYEKERREANFRYSLVRFRDNMEGVALYKGEKAEKGIFASRFSEIVENFNAILNRVLIFYSWSSFYDQFNVIFPALLAAPRLFAKEITFGGLMQTFQAFKQVSECLSFFVENYPTIASWCATTNRLLEFKLQLENIPPSPLIHGTHDQELIQMDCDHLSLPHGVRLNEGLQLTFKNGEHTLISGPTGIGKSTLARAIAGLWPYGKGEIRIPASSFLFLPQKSYMPLGNLKSVLLYPNVQASHEEMADVLDLVGLEGFLDRLDEVNDWARVLSLGEQQRLSMARALLVKPLWLILDEATSAMDEASEAHLYHILKTCLPGTTLISIGHRESLKALHLREVRLGEDLFQLQEAVA